MEPITKDDLKDFATKQDINELKLYIVDRETSWLKWVVGFQLTYFAITLGAMYFMLQHISIVHG